MIIYAILAGLVAFIPSLALIVWIYLQVLRTKSDVSTVFESWDRNKAIIQDALAAFQKLQTENSELKAQILSVSHANDSLHESLASLVNKISSRSRAERKAERDALDEQPGNILPLTPSREAAPLAGGVVGVRRLIRTSAGA